MAEFRILSLDGGGSWALIQVKALIALYSPNGTGADVTGHDVLKKFDLVAGNSGGTLTLGGLIKNWTLAQLLQLFLTQDMRGKIFVPATFFEDPFAHFTQIANFGPKYHAKAKITGLRDILGAEGDQLVTAVPAAVGANYAGRQPHVLFCSFNYDTNRAAFFRSDAASLSASRAIQMDTTVSLAIHASSNAPVNYFDAPANGPNHSRFWDGAIGGYNNPVLAGVIEALANAGRYNTSRAEIKALSLGTGNVALPLSLGSPNENPDLVIQRDSSTMINDLLKLATSVIDDPPDAATFHAHIMLDGPLPGPATVLPVDSPIVRMNPLVQPVMINNAWAVPPGMDQDAFTAIRKLDMDAIEQKDVDAIMAFCENWQAGNVPNQPIRANSSTLTPEIGHGRYAAALAAAKRMFA